MPTTHRRKPPPSAAAGKGPAKPPLRKTGHKLTVSPRTPPSLGKRRPSNSRIKRGNPLAPIGENAAANTPAGKKRKKKTSGKKRFRRVKVLRWWVLPATFFIPLGVLLLEYYIGKLISLDDVKDTYYQQFGIDPWEFDVPPSDKLGVVPSVANLTGFAIKTKTNCSDDLKGMINLHNPKSHSVGDRKIPMILHQHGSSRCMTRKFYTASVTWASTFKRWSYYFHDDQAIERLVNDTAFPEFPLLKAVSTNCLDSLHTSKLGLDLWKFLNLWVFGGIYVDLNYKPGRFDANTVLAEDDGVFFIDPLTDTPSTKIMAFSPRHPLLFYAIRRILDNLFDSTSSTNTTTGEIALREALMDFRKSKFSLDGPLSPGNFQGPRDRSIRIVSDVEKSGLVKRVTETETELKRDYATMGWVYPDDAVAGGDCLRKLYSQVLN